MAKPSRRSRPADKAGAAAWITAAVGLGLGAGIAVERLLIGRTRIKPDPFAEETYGALEADRTSTVVAGDGARLLVEERGPLAPKGAIFLHGLCLDRSVWHHQLQELSRDFRCIYYDARHHGESVGGADPTDVSLLSQDLESVLDNTNLDEAVLVGHSMGGMSVLEFCRRNPERLRKQIAGIVLINTTYTDALKTLVAAELVVPLEKRLGWLVAKLLDNPRAAKRLRLRGDDLSYLLVRKFGFGSDSSPAQVEYIRRLLAQFPSPELVETMKGIRKFEMQDALEAVDVPVLIIAGGDDRITTVNASREMAEKLPDCRLVVLDGAGHTTMMERHQEVTDELRSFFEKVLG